MKFKQIYHTLLTMLSQRRLSLPYFHRTYGKFYTPYYNLCVPFENVPRQIYNKQGLPLQTFFLRDVHVAHTPYWESKYFIWDRYNFGLDTHFYSHETMLQTMGKPTKRFGFLIESESIVPASYKLFDKYAGLHKDFDAILHIQIKY